jgi:stearoyl-CoA desaturase (delta-9 desaturase)
MSTEPKEFIKTKKGYCREPMKKLSGLKLLFHRLVVLVMIIGPAFGTVWAFVSLGLGMVGWREMAIFGSFYVATGLGVTVGYHRLLTHQSFKTNPLVRSVLLVFGTWSLQGTPITWASTHLAHHVNSDREHDPHSPVKSLFHAHMGWLFSGIKYDPKTYAKAQLQDPVAVFVTKTTAFWVVLSFVLPFLFGGWNGLIWAGLVRVFLVHHITWSVNSFSHAFGGQEYKSVGDRSRNNWLVGILALGEGWHNNHHAFPKSAFHGLRWYQLDVSGLFIRLLGAVHLAKDIYRVPRNARLGRRLEPRGT